MSYKLKFLTNTKKGLSRVKNQDRILTLDKNTFYFFALFDGVSSYSNSHELISEVKKKIQLKINEIDAEGNNIEKVLYQSNKESSKPFVRGASTLSALFISKLNNVVKFVNIGDSRIYVFNNQFLEQVTKDDSVELGSNIITKYLGDSELTLDDFKSTRLEQGYNFLLCTDGFYSLMEENLKEYFNTLNYKYIKNIKRRISYLQRRENKDDSTYIIIKNEISI